MNRIKQLREEFHLTQIQLAEKLNKTQQAISLYENGSNEPDLDGYIMLSKIFNCSIEYIAGKSDIRNPEEIKFANNNGIDIEGLSEEEINEIQRQVEFMRWKKKDTKDEDK